MAFSLPKKPSIAVLPFRNLSHDTKTEYFGIGLTEDIINGLSKFRSLFVISAGSMLAYKEKPVAIRKVAEDLGVRFVFRGSVRKDATQLKITAQLIDAVKGAFLWSERYDRELKDIFSVQDDITLNILKMLQVNLLARDKSRLYEHTTSNLQAYLKVVEGRMESYNFNFNEALKCFEEARSLDPRYADAYAYEAFIHVNNYWLGPRKNRMQSLIAAKESEKKCEELSNKISACTMIRAVIDIAQFDCFDALNEAKQVVEYWPNSSEAATIFAMILSYCGNYEEALGQIEKALRMNPYRVELAWSMLGRTYFCMGKYEKAINVCNKLLAIHPYFLPALLTLALSHGSRGQRAEAAAAVKKIWKIRPDFSANDFTFAFWKTEKEINRILRGILDAEPKQR
jgi:adenylate cyclase